MKLTPLLFSLIGLLAPPLLQATISLNVVVPEAFYVRDDESNRAYRQAYQEFKAGNYEQSETLAKEAVDSGSPAGYFILGWLHEKGLGRPVNLETALDYYRQGHEKDFAMTSLRFGILLVNATGPEKEIRRTEGRKILEKLNGESASFAQLILGKSHAMGYYSATPDFGTAMAHLNRAIELGNQEATLFKAGLLEGQYQYPKINLPDAIVTFEKAATLGAPEAIIAAGTRRLNGPEVIRDEIKGVHWLQSLADKDDPIANYQLGNYYALQKKDYETAFPYLIASAEKKSPQALYLLGVLHQNGNGTETSEEKAIEYYEEAATLGHLQAAHNLARIYLAQEDNQTRHLNVKKGYHFLVFAASKLRDAQAELGILYLSGQLGAKDLTAAAAWLDKAARAGHATAQNNLAALYELGNGVPLNLESAYELYSLAAKQGHLSAISALGRLTATGQGTEKNLPLAWAYLSIAAEGKDEAAPNLLAQLNSLLNKDQLAAGKKELQAIKASLQNQK